MTVTGESTDVVVVGAGTAGANAAYQIARQGRQVVLVERRPADDGGAQWNNGTLDWQFERADVAPPTGAERVAEHGVTHIVGPEGQPGVTLVSPTVTTDMALLGRRLRTLALDAGVTILDRAEHLSAEYRGTRLASIEVTTPEGSRRRLAASLFVDATGRRGVLRSQSPVLQPWCPTVRGQELCSAADVHLEITDGAGAGRFLEAHHASPGETVTAVGVNGGFSTVAITVGEDLDHARVLVGCLATGRHGTGPRMLGELRDREPWLGPTISGGFGVIPLRRPYARFTAPGLALVGDAACQVFPAHGSGIGTGLIAGTTLARVVAGLEDPGDEHGLWNYQAQFQRELGGVLLASDIFRRLSTEMGSDGARTLISAGLINETNARAGLDQRWPEPSATELVDMAGRLSRHPGLARRMLPRLVRGQMAGRLAQRYPVRVDLEALDRWDRTARRLLGTLPN